jgi:hypothetical protein
MNVLKSPSEAATQTVTYLINSMPLRVVDFSTPIDMLTGIISFKVSLNKFECVLCIIQVQVLVNLMQSSTNMGRIWIVVILVSI